MNKIFIKIFKIIDFIIFEISIPKTIYFNFKYFGLSGLKVLPVFIHKNTELKKTEGRIKIQNFKTGIIKIGFGQMGNYPKKICYSSFENDGKIVFQGKCLIGVCSTISNHGLLTIGSNLNITADSHIICFKSIKIGNNCLISWKTQIMDSDQHKIYDNNDNWLNKPENILIGDNCWICSGTTILKGGGVGNNIIIAANTLLTKFIAQDNVIVGNYGKIIKKNITWKE